MLLASPWLPALASAGPTTGCPQGFLDPWKRGRALSLSAAAKRASRGLSDVLARVLRLKSVRGPPPIQLNSAPSLILSGAREPRVRQGPVASIGGHCCRPAPRVRRTCVRPQDPRAAQQAAPRRVTNGRYRVHGQPPRLRVYHAARRHGLLPRRAARPRCSRGWRPGAEPVPRRSWRNRSARRTKWLRSGNASRDAGAARGGGGGGGAREEASERRAAEELAAATRAREEARRAQELQKGAQRRAREAEAAREARAAEAKTKTVLLVGLAGAGKTTALHKLKLGEVVTHHVLEVVELKGWTFTACDLGHHFNDLLRHGNVGDVRGLVFVVDSTDADRLQQARDELHRLCKDKRLREAVLLVFANKQDVPTALYPRELEEKLGRTVAILRPPVARPGVLRDERRRLVRGSRLVAARGAPPERRPKRRPGSRRAARARGGARAERRELARSSARRCGTRGGEKALAAKKAEADARAREVEAEARRARGRRGEARGGRRDLRGGTLPGRDLRQGLRKSTSELGYHAVEPTRSRRQRRVDGLTPSSEI